MVDHKAHAAKADFEKALLDTLRAAGVHSMQGYRFGKPGSTTLMGARLAAPAAWRSIGGDAAALAG